MKPRPPPSREAQRPPAAGRTRSVTSLATDSSDVVLNVPLPAVQLAAEFVFVRAPRVFRFGHRATTSLRHPLLPMLLSSTDTSLAILGLDSGGSALTLSKQAKPKPPMTVPERIVESLRRDNNVARMESDRWHHVGDMTDSVLLDSDMTQRRTGVMESLVVRRVVEEWWCQAGGSVHAGVSRSVYRDVHAKLVEEIVGQRCAAWADDAFVPQLLRLLTVEGIERDYDIDANGSDTVPFARWYISLLELADNWVGGSDAEKYAAFLRKLIEPAFRSVRAAWNDARRSSDASQWEETAARLRQRAFETRSYPLISVTRSGVSQFIVYEKKPFME